MSIKSLALGLINSHDHTSEVNLAAYAAGCIVLGVCLVWWAVMGPRDGNLVAGMGVFAAAITTGLIKKAASQPPQQEGGAE